MGFCLSISSPLISFLLPFPSLPLFSFAFHPFLLLPILPFLPLVIITQFLSLFFPSRLCLLFLFFPSLPHTLVQNSGLQNNFLPFSFLSHHSYPSLNFPSLLYPFHSFHCLSSSGSSALLRLLSSSKSIRFPASSPNYTRSFLTQPAALPFTWLIISVSSGFSSVPSPLHHPRFLALPLPSLFLHLLCIPFLGSLSLRPPPSLSLTLLPLIPPTFFLHIAYGICRLAITGPHELVHLIFGAGI